MARHKNETPTNVELEILQVLWQRGPSTVREIVDELNRARPRAYTSILSMLNVMYEKGLVVRDMQGRAHVYRARSSREKTLGRVVKDLLGRAFEGRLWRSAGSRFVWNSARRAGRGPASGKRRSSEADRI